MTEKKVRVLLRRLEGMTFREVGIVAAVHGRQVTVDGIAAPFEIDKSFTVVPAGELLHLSRVAHDRVGAVLRDEPQAVIAQVLHESGRLSARGIKQKLVELRFDRSEVDRAWTRAKKQLEDFPQLSTKGPSSQSEYVWQGDPPSPSLAERVGVSIGSGSIGDSASDHPHAARDECDGGAARVTERGDGKRGSQQTPAPASRAKVGTSGTESPPEQELEDPRSVLTAIRALEPDVDLPSVAALRRRLLATARELQRHGDPALEALFENTTGGARRLAASLLVGLPRKSLLGQRAAEALDGEASQQVLNSALDEIARTPASRRRKLGEAASYLIERLMLNSPSGDMPTSQQAQVLAAVPSFGLRTTRLLEAVTDHLARDLRQGAAPTRDELATWDLGGIARALAHLRYERVGPRSALVSALHRIAPRGLMAEERWWTNTRLPDLLDAGDGSLASVLEDPTVSERVVRPLVSRALRDARSRRTLGELFGAPAPLATQIDATHFRNAFERVASGDPSASDWLGALTDKSAIERAEEAALDAQAATHAAEKLASEAAARSKQLAVENGRLRDLVSQAHQASVAMSSGQERQVKLDLVRTLAVLALDVRQSEAAENDAALTRQVDYLTQREGLDPIHASGDRVPFDPARHDSLGVHLDPGSPVIVLRPGYTWSSEYEDLVLIKAQVATYS